MTPGNIPNVPKFSDQQVIDVHLFPELRPPPHLARKRLCSKVFQYNLCTELHEERGQILNLLALLGAHGGHTVSPASGGDPPSSLCSALPGVRLLLLSMFRNLHLLRLSRSSSGDESETRTRELGAISLERCPRVRKSNLTRETRSSYRAGLVQVGSG